VKIPTTAIIRIIMAGFAFTSVKIRLSFVNEESILKYATAAKNAVKIIEIVK